MTQAPAKPKGAKKRPRDVVVKEKLTEAEVKFCEIYARGGKKIPAYREAFGNDTANDKTIWRRVDRIMGYPKIQKRLKELEERVMERFDVTVESLIRELEEARMAALSAETAQASAAVSATMGKAKLAGLDKQKVELTGVEGGSIFPSRIELVAPNGSNSKG